MKNRIILLPAIFLLATMLGACSNTSTLSNIIPQMNLPRADFNKLPNGKDIQQANTFLNAGKKREAASAYFAASKNYQSPERERLMLQAAELAATFRDAGLTQRYLSPINFSALTKENQTRFRFTQAQLALNDRNYHEALRILPQRVNGLPISLAKKILGTRMTAAQASGDKLALIQELTLQEPTLTQEHQIKLNDDRIWNHVLSMPLPELALAKNKVHHPTLKGWLDLGHLVKGFKGSGTVSPIFRVKLRDWQKNHRNHPGNVKAEQLFNYKSTTKVTPYLGGIKPSKGK